MPLIKYRWCGPLALAKVYRQGIAVSIALAVSPDTSVGVPAGPGEDVIQRLLCWVIKIKSYCRLVGSKSVGLKLRLMVRVRALASSIRF